MIQFNYWSFWYALAQEIHTKKPNLLTAMLTSHLNQIYLLTYIKYFIELYVKPKTHIPLSLDSRPLISCSGQLKGFKLLNDQNLNFFVVDTRGQLKLQI